MARVEYTFTFTNALPGAAVSFGDTDVFSSATDQDANGPSLQLDADSSIVVWSEAANLTAHTVDGLGEKLAATATKAAPTVTTDEGTAGTSPFGRGTSSAFSATKVAKVVPVLDPAVVITAGTQFDVNYTGATIIQGEDYAGVGGALPLPVTIAANRIVLPELDCRYDLHLNVALTCDAADEGKLVGLTLSGVNVSPTFWAPVFFGYAVFTVESTDWVFATDEPSLNCQLNCNLLTANATLADATFVIAKQ
jgi:hypothetical protein